MKTIERILKKIIPAKELPQVLAYLRFKESKIVFTNGCFDILHRGHLEYLLKASDLENVFMIGLNSDRSVKKLKGEERPVLNEETRAMMLASFLFVDYVVLFEEKTPYELIKTVQPDVLVKGGDYKVDEIVGHDVVLEKGGMVTTIPFVEGYSTTNLIRRMKNIS